MLVVVLTLAGCSIGGPAAGSAGDPRLMEGPNCYREAKSEYEAAGTSQNPNAALMNIGSELGARENPFERCSSAAGSKPTK